MQATMNKAKGDAGVVMNGPVSAKLAQSFIEKLKEHRHWDREALVGDLPF